ncbi:MAG: transcriptional regulator [Dokdonella sp.]
MTRSYHFGDFRLDPATRELHRGDAPVPVPPRAFDCIVYLVEHRERAVGRDELIAAVWGKADISDGLLAQTVLAMRRAFDDTGKEQSHVRTVVRFGYHWVAPTSVVEDAPTAPVATIPDAVVAPASATPASVMPARSPSVDIARHPARSMRLVVAIALFAALLAVAAVLGLRHEKSRTTAVSPDAAAHAAIALVLPVDVVAGEGSEWIRLGLMDHVATRLRAAGLPVVPSDNVVVLTDAAHRASGGADAAALAVAAGANVVIEARAERDEQNWHVRLHTQLGRTPPVDGNGASTNVLLAAQIAADDLARHLGFAPVAGAAPAVDRSGLDALLQEAEAAILNDRLDDARALLARAPAAQRDQPEVRLRLAQIDYQAGKFDAAESAFAALVQSVSIEQDRVLHARALSNLGVIAAMRNNTTVAAKRFDEAIALLRGQNAPDALGKALNGRANVAGALDQVDLALQAFAEARVAFESSGNLLALALIDSNLAALDMRRERYAEAIPVFRRAADRFATFGVHAAELNALMGVAELQLALLEPAAALTLEPRLRDLTAQVADPARHRNGEMTRLTVLVANGREQGVKEQLATLLAAAERDNDPVAQARGHALAARLALEHGDAHAAGIDAARAIEHFAAADDAREFARAYMLRIEALLAESDASAASRVAEELSTFAARAGSAAARLYADLAQARTSASPDAAATWYARAIGEADSLRIPLDLREVATAYAQWLIGRGETARASAQAERIAGFASRDFDSALLQVRIHQALGEEALWRSALARAQALAGDRPLPAALAVAPIPR